MKKIILLSSLFSLVALFAIGQGFGPIQNPTTGGAAIVGTVSNDVASAGLLAVDDTKTNGIAATTAHVTSALGFTPQNGSATLSNVVAGTHVIPWATGATNAINATNFAGTTISMSGALNVGGAAHFTNDVTVDGTISATEFDVGTIVLTNGIDGTNILGVVTNAYNAGVATNVQNISSNIVAGTGITLATNGGAITITVKPIYTAPTNTWTVDSTFGIGTNSVLAMGTATGGITGVANASSTEQSIGELTVLSTGTAVFTNIASIHASDGLTSRTITNGTSACIAIQVIPGQRTNMAIVHFP